MLSHVHRRPGQAQDTSRRHTSTAQKPGQVYAVRAPRHVPPDRHKQPIVLRHIPRAAPTDVPVQHNPETKQPLTPHHALAAQKTLACPVAVSRRGHRWGAHGAHTGASLHAREPRPGGGGAGRVKHVRLLTLPVPVAQPQARAEADELHAVEPPAHIGSTSPL